jgi:CHASE3 domain sensor protein
MDRLRSVRGPTITLLIVGCLCLLLLVVLNLLFGTRAQEASETVNDARELLTHAVSLRSALQTAEASQRGYLLTGNEIYLAPLATALDEAERGLAALRARQADLPTSGKAFQTLEAVIQGKLDELVVTVDQYRRGNREIALETVSGNRGKALMDEANVFISAIIRSAERDLSAGVARQQDSLRTVRISTYLAVLAVFVVTVGIYFFQRWFVRDLQTANDQVKFLNADLEARVEERTH